MKYTFKLKNTAFTMIELIFVIVVLGILATLALSRIDRDIRQEAADNILSDIRYTQHLALMSSKHKFDEPKWQRAFWRIGFEYCSGSTDFYEYIGSDSSNYGGGIDDIEASIDPANGKKMIWSGAACPEGKDKNTSNRIFITYKYGINTITYNGGCSNAQYIGFDHLGRPHQGFTGSTIPDYSSLMIDNCNITFSFNDSSLNPFSIIINKETGYTYIDNQEDS